METREPSVFERIVARELPATIVFENERLIALHPLEPQAPVHLLVVPKTAQYATVAELAAGDPELLAEVVATAQTLADSHADGHFRLVFNSGENAGQTVFHVHAHVLAGGLAEGSLAHG
ncbi:HIT domain-containing protein [Microcella sp.]|uniref:HIT domain-containing protein n=1 Tax=Microcella sp. TaxID=1913979 RepID=UPI00391B967E